MNCRKMPYNAEKCHVGILSFLEKNTTMCLNVCKKYIKNYTLMPLCRKEYVTHILLSKVQVHVHVHVHRCVYSYSLSHIGIFGSMLLTMSSGCGFAYRHIGAEDAMWSSDSVLCGITAHEVLS